MNVTVVGGLGKIMLESDKATAILINTDDGRPTVIFKMLSDGKGWLRVTQGEDKNFNEVAHQLGLLK